MYGVSHFLSKILRPVGAALYDLREKVPDDVRGLRVFREAGTLVSSGSGERPMSRPDQILSSDLRAVVRTVGECGELWADPDAWREHLVRRANELARSHVGTWQSLRFADNPIAPRMVSCTEVGWLDSDTQRHFDRWRQDQGKMVGLDRAMANVSRLGSWSFARPDLVEDAIWYASECYNDYMSLADCDHFIASIRTGRAPGAIDMLAVMRPLGERPFTRREIRLVGWLHDAIADLVGRRLAVESQRGVHGLSPRCRETLELLLGGEGEKQIASRLCLSRHTIHEYVTTIYRHFEVSSRAELMAYFIRRRPEARRAGLTEGRRLTPPV